MTEALTLSAIQYQALAGGIVPNVEEHVRLIEDAESHGARLVIFPELSLTGYDLASLSADEAWLRPDDPRLGDLHEICRRTGITAVAGAAYRESDGTPRLATLAIHPSGVTDFGFTAHLRGPEQELFTSGNRALILELDGWHVAVAGGADASDPLRPTEAALAGADIYAVPAVYTVEEDPRLALHLGATAMDHKMFGVLANLGGVTPLGRSCGLSGFWGPGGHRMEHAAGTGTEVVTAVLQRGALRKFR
ncbi:MAG: carbon-nitrogen hydrolase family protein [Pseudarthrobacter sp.]